MVGVAVFDSLFMGRSIAQNSLKVDISPCFVYILRSPSVYFLFFDLTWASFSFFSVFPFH